MLASLECTNFTVDFILSFSSKRLNKILRSVEATRMFSVAENDFRRFLQKREIAATHIYQNHTILEIKIFGCSNKIAIESTTYSFPERTLSFPARRLIVKPRGARKGPKIQ